jgi:phage/plasmid primase-like uncharacterized protein
LWKGLIGQAWVVNQATRAAAVVCFGVGNMSKDVKALREKYPAARLVIVPDNGKENQAACMLQERVLPALKLLVYRCPMVKE